MSESDRWIAKCQDAGDGSGDLIVDLPLELLAKTGLIIGDELDLEIVNGAIVLTPKPRTSPMP
jgi:antitoxin ChpS